MDLKGQDIMEINSLKQFAELRTNYGGGLIIVHFTAKWSPHCKQLHEALEEIRKQLSGKKAMIVEVEAEDHPSISQQFSVVAVPTCILLKDGLELSRVEGIDIQEIYTKIQQHVNSSNEEKDINSFLKSLINQSLVMVFMKGTPEHPRCGFSKTLIGLLNAEGVTFGSFDILSNEKVRQGLKEFSNWPTYPQLYINGELIGGLDIVKELIERGEFKDLLPKENKLEEKLTRLINKEKIMLFLKGSPDDVKCGFSKSIIEILNSKRLKYGHFDILTNEEVRQGLKEFSKWPTYPQLYIKGDLVGGLDIVKELDQSGELDKLLKD